MKSIYFALVLVSFPALADSWTTASSYSHASAQAGAVAGSISNSGGNTFQGGSTSYKEERQVPVVIAPSINPTASCMGSSSAGAAGSTFGLSLGSSWTDDDCNYRVTADMMHGWGLKADALAVLCSSKFAQPAPSCAAFRPAECHADEVVAKRLGVGVCK